MTLTEDWPESPIAAMHTLTSAMQHVLKMDQDWETEGYETFELLKGCREAIHRECYPGSYGRSYGRG